MQINRLTTFIAMLLFLGHSNFTFAYNIFLNNNSQEVQVILDNNWQIGNMATIALYPIPKNMQATASLYDTSSNKLRTFSKFYYHTIKDKPNKQAYSTMLSHLGLSAYLRDKSYLLEIKLIDDKGVESIGHINVKIQHKKFKTIIVKMGKQGTKIATKGRKPNKKRIQQSKDFYLALKSFTDKAYDSGKVYIPVKKKYRLSSEFGLKRIFLYSDGSKGTDFHNGIDFAGMKIGTPIYSILSGKVVYAKHRIVTGGTVIIEHLPGVYSLYYHMNTVNTVVGMKLKRGSFVGTLGNKGFSTGPHLHLGMYASGVDIDPSRFIKEPILDETFLLNKFKQIDVKLDRSLIIFA